VVGRLGWMALFEYFVRNGIAEPYGQRSAEMTVRMHMLMQYFADKMAQLLKQFRIVFCFRVNYLLFSSKIRKYL
jgi:hypothetical protein